MEYKWNIIYKYNNNIEMEDKIIALVFLKVICSQSKGL